MKENKMVFILIIVALVIALCVVYYFGFIKNKEANNEPTQSNISTNIDGEEITDGKNTNKCYTDGKYYYLMLYKTYLGTKNQKLEPANEQRRFCLLVTDGPNDLGELYGWYNIENNKIDLILDSDSYTLNKNILNMMISDENNKIEVKGESSQYIVTLDYSEKTIKYGGNDLKLIEN